MKIFDLTTQRATKVALLTASALLVGCANMQSLDALSTQPTYNPDLETSVSGETKLKLNTVYQRYHGTLYVYGGTTSKGFDCSGFINAAFEEAFNIDLPRTTGGIAKTGTPIMRNQLVAGDIVFFKTSAKDLHAGIYIESGRFIHASTSKGVTESSLDNAYWKSRYIYARRFL